MDKRITKLEKEIEEQKEYCFNNEVHPDEMVWLGELLGQLKTLKEVRDTIDLLKSKVNLYSKNHRTSIKTIPKSLVVEMIKELKQTLERESKNG